MLNKMSFFLYLGLFLILTPLSAFSQGESDIYLLQIKVKGGKYVFGNPVKINQIKGYNDQPSFHPDGGSLFYSSGSGSSTDIYRYDIETGKTTRLTDTPESEYSPTVIPGGKQFSVIQLVISDGPRKGAQPLLAFPLVGGGSKMIYEEGEKVGYHTWIDAQKVALFLLGSPSSLEIVDLKDRSSIRVAENIGRSLYKIPGQDAISFSQSKEGRPAAIMMYNLGTGKIKPLVPMLEGNQFYTWTSSGVLIMGVGPKLFGFKPGEYKDWQLIGDLSSLGVKNVSRLAVDPNLRWLAVVSSQ